ncbi:ABC transporter substrate-binding protein [Gluconacetobacter azotocaptans]|uniref:ABC transporter substrate-binding protein n=1 Tax=Gluconacetobacter azotocaptans TaxID=142834 RepID=UPI0019575C73|nr:ABC transporter substrate-binding protein [Gluconacetobacter azotocaptans]MBM9399995.1 ABC transporter substrate-binding protein [Gluconacetobacter azotocaptans]
MSNSFDPCRSLSRRQALMGLGAGVMLSAAPAYGAGARGLTLQLGWVAGGNQLGELVARQRGYFQQENVDLRIVPGGPNNDGVAAVASGSADMGQVTSSPSLMLAASEDLPVRAFAVLTRRHPYAFFSLPQNPVRRPADFIGKRIGVPATARVLVSAMLNRNGIARKDVDVVTIGSDMMPLLNGQIDAVSGWVNNRAALRVLGSGVVTLKLWDCGVRLYGIPYYTTPDMLARHSDVLAAFLRASARGWAYAYRNRAEAVDILVSTFPALTVADERAAADVLLDYVFDGETRVSGFGSMNAARWQEQIDLYDSLDQFTNRVPKAEDVMTMRILDDTAGMRPCLG